MRGYKTLIQEAELLAMEPAAVAEFLRERSEKQDSIWNDSVDEDTEKALWARKSPLIDLALARYGRHLRTAITLFKRVPVEPGIRLAVLSNRGITPHGITPFPYGLWIPPASEKNEGEAVEGETFIQWAESAPAEEHTALFENPSLSDEFLKDFLERKNLFSALSDEQFAPLVGILHRNDRLRIDPKPNFWDGYTDYLYHGVFNAAWSLAETVEPTLRWATVLGWLYTELVPDAISIKEPLALVDRWKSPDDLIEKEAADNTKGWLSSYQRVRRGLARLVLVKNRKLLPDLLNSEDAALRSAAYAFGALTVEQMDSAWDRDGELANNELVQNEHLWRTNELRTKLHDIAWAAVSSDKHSDLVAASTYSGVDERMRKKHPEWFRDEEQHNEGIQESELDPNQIPATQADLVLLAEHLQQSGAELTQIKQNLKALLARMGWIWWFSLGSLLTALSLKQF